MPWNNLKGASAVLQRRQRLMKAKLRAGLLLCLIIATAFCVYGAYGSMRRSSRNVVPEEVYAQFKDSEGKAEFYLRSCNGYVAVYPVGRARSPMTVTDIETAQLRGTDRALLDNGIPVLDRAALLYLLEDLGS